MKFEEFESAIISQIHSYSTVQYGCIRIEYLKVLGIKDGKIVELGEIIWNAFLKRLCSVEELKAFGKECEKFRIGQVEEMPSVCYDASVKLRNYLN